jgi:hypothetical protein
MMNLLGPPTIEYCEKPIQGLIKRPYYAVSNLAFLLSGFLILSKGKMNRLSKIFGFTAITIGLLSFFYDASYLYFSQLLDLTGMLLFVNILLYLNLDKLFKSSKYLILMQVISYLASISAIIYFQGFAGNVVFGIYVLSVIVTEYLLCKQKLHQNYGYWVLAIVLFVVGFAIWLLDASKLFCFTFGLLNGRAVFHYLNAFSIYYLYKFYALNG